MNKSGATTSRIASSKGPGIGKAPMPAAHRSGLGIRRSRAMSFPALSVLAMNARARRTPASLGLALRTGPPLEPERAVFPVVRHEQRARGREGQRAPRGGVGDEQYGGEAGQDHARRTMVAALAEDPQTTANNVVVERTAKLSKLLRSVHGVVRCDINNPVIGIKGDWLQHLTQNAQPMACLRLKIGVSERTGRLASQRDRVAP